MIYEYVCLDMVYDIKLIEMFHRLAKHFFRLLPFSAIVSGYLCYNRPFKMSEGPLSDKYSHLNNKVNSKIKIIKDIEVFLRG